MKKIIRTVNVEVKDKRHINLTSKTFILGKRKKSKNVRTQNQVKDGTKIRKNENVIQNDNYDFEVERYPKNKKPKFEKPKI